MEGTPERQHLEEALKDEQAGSAKIRAMADYVRLKQVEQMLKREMGRKYIEDDTISYWERQQIVLSIMIEQQYFKQDAYEYSVAFDNADVVFAPYLKTEDPYHIFLNDLREINRQKSRK
jgi:hypothetical protein